MQHLSRDLFLFLLVVGCFLYFGQKIHLAYGPRSNGVFVQDGPLDPKTSATKKSLIQVSNAVNQFYRDCGKYPDSLVKLTEISHDCKRTGKGRYLASVPQDGFGDSLEYKNFGANFILNSKNFKDPSMSADDIKTIYKDRIFNDYYDQ